MYGLTQPTINIHLDSSKSYKCAIFAINALSCSKCYGLLYIPYKATGRISQSVRRICCAVGMTINSRASRLIWTHWIMSSCDMLLYDSNQSLLLAETHLAVCKMTQQRRLIEKKKKKTYVTTGLRIKWHGVCGSGSGYIQADAKSTLKKK